MPVLLTTRRDITLDAFRRVAWEGEGVALAPEARGADGPLRGVVRGARARARVDADPGALIYGVTTAPGDGAAVALDAERLARRPTRLWSAVSYGEPLPERVVRGIVLARLANLLDGHAAARAEVARRGRGDARRRLAAAGRARAGQRRRRRDHRARHACSSTSARGSS